MEWTREHLTPCWDEQYKDLKYTKQPFNGEDEIQRWRMNGYGMDEKYFTGEMCEIGRASCRERV